MTMISRRALKRFSTPGSFAALAVVAFGLAFVAAPGPASAQTSTQSNGFLDNAPFASLFRKPPQAAAEPSGPAAKPMKLGGFMRKPVATSSTRISKKTDGTFKKVAVAKKESGRRSKQRAAAAEAASRPAQPTASEAFALQAEAAVRVVGPDEVNEIDLAAPAAEAATNEPAMEMAAAAPAALKPVAKPITAQAGVAPPNLTKPAPTQPVAPVSVFGKTTPSKAQDIQPVNTAAANPPAAAATDGKGAAAMQVVSLEDRNRGFIVKPAGSTPTQSLMAARPLPDPEQNSWFQSMLIMIGGAFVAASAAVRFLMA